LHIPLHRTLSAILQKLVLLPWDNFERGFLSALLPRGNHERDKFTKDEVLCSAISVSWFIELLPIRGLISFLIQLSHTFMLNALGDSFRFIHEFLAAI
jgi:hypothetical protein